ncbi:hypothetical protein WISP_24731 [Willisornis vidua]|uniref:Uncharacterized protein n=1 Tax=Willisornis vidua TaxID=1566151 RepID=A0ABQ9DTC6_9PASS|nr:hypothetical protein WISP_24731 [Willisornis vidua]
MELCLGKDEEPAESLWIKIKGDFNHTKVCWRENTSGHKQSQRFFECINNFLSQVNENPKRTGAMLDPVLKNKEELIANEALQGSDHKMVEFKVPQNSCVTTPKPTVHLGFHGPLKTLKPNNHSLSEIFQQLDNDSFLSFAKPEAGGWKDTLSEGNSMGEMLRTCVDWMKDSRAIYSSARLGSLHFHYTASVYIYLGMNKLSDSQYTTIERGVCNCWKADGLTLLSMPDKNNKKKNYWPGGIFP